MAEGVRQVLRTPTLALTTAGLALAGLYLGGHDWAVKPAIVCLAVPGIGGTAIAIYRQVQAAGERWVWSGIVRAFRKPLTDEARAGIAGHLGQALLALLLLLTMRREEKVNGETEKE